VVISDPVDLRQCRFHCIRAFIRPEILPKEEWQWLAVMAEHTHEDIGGNDKKRVLAPQYSKRSIYRRVVGRRIENVAEPAVYRVASTRCEFR
jgi:hypothetical protein